MIAFFLSASSFGSKNNFNFFSFISNSVFKSDNSISAISFNSLSAELSFKIFSKSFLKKIFMILDLFELTMFDVVIYACLKIEISYILEEENLLLIFYCRSSMCYMVVLYYIWLSYGCYISNVGLESLDLQYFLRPHQSSVSINVNCVSLPQMF